MNLVLNQKRKVNNENNQTKSHLNILTVSTINSTTITKFENENAATKCTECWPELCDCRTTTNQLTRPLRISIS